MRWCGSFLLIIICMTHDLICGAVYIVFFLVHLRSPWNWKIKSAKKRNECDAARFLALVRAGGVHHAPPLLEPFLIYTKTIRKELNCHFLLLLSTTRTWEHKNKIDTYVLEMWRLRLSALTLIYRTWTHAQVSSFSTLTFLYYFGPQIYSFTSLDGEN